MGTEFNQVNTQMSDFEMAEPSFEDAFRKHFDSLAHYADQQGARDLQEKGEDVAQVAMMRMANQGDRMSFAAAGPWLHLVAKRIVIDNYRLARNRYEVVT